MNAWAWVKCSEKTPRGNQDLWVAYKFKGAMLVERGYFCNANKTYQFHNDNPYADYDTTIPNPFYWMPYNVPEPPED